MDAAATTEKEVSRSYIPEDIAFSILSKLPFKSLKRFECLRKSWSLLLENPYFMTIFRKNFISKLHSYSYGDDNTSLILHNQSPFANNPHDKSLYTLFGERYENRVKLEWPTPFHEHHPAFNFVNCDSINGTFCLYAIQTKEALLWNLATKEFKILPSSSVESIPPYRTTSIHLHGYGYDHIRDDYKVIRHVIFNPFNDEDAIYFGFSLDDIPWDDLSYDPPVWEIYSLRSNSWRILDLDMPRFCNGTTIGSRLYMDGMCYWWGVRQIRYNEVYEAYLVSFDLSKEIFITTPIPSDDDSYAVNCVQRHLVVLNGSISLISYWERKYIFDISILGKIGVKESWTKLFVIETLPCIGDLIGVGNNGVLFFIKKDDELVWFDLGTQIFEELGIKGRRLISHIITYKEGILPIEGICN